MPFKSVAKIHYCLNASDNSKNNTWRWNCKKWLDKTKNPELLPYKVRYAKPYTGSLKKIKQKINEEYVSYLSKKNKQFTDTERKMIYENSTFSGKLITNGSLFFIRVTDELREKFSIFGDYVIFKVKYDGQNNKYINIHNKKHYLISIKKL